MQLDLLDITSMTVGFTAILTFIFMNFEQLAV